MNDALKQQLDKTHDRLVKALQGLDRPALTARPSGLAPILWQAGHITASEAGFLRLAGDGVELSKDFREAFKAGTSGEAPLPEADLVLEKFGLAQQGMKKAAGGDLARPLEHPRGLYATLGEGLLHMLGHRGYHAAKIATLKRLLHH